MRVIKNHINLGDPLTAFLARFPIGNAALVSDETVDSDAIFTMPVASKAAAALRLAGIRTYADAYHAAQRDLNLCERTVGRCIEDVKGVGPVTLERIWNNLQLIEEAFDAERKAAREVSIDLARSQVQASTGRTLFATTSFPDIQSAVAAANAGRLLAGQYLVDATDGERIRYAGQRREGGPLFLYRGGNVSPSKFAAVRRSMAVR